MNISCTDFAFNLNFWEFSFAENIDFTTQYIDHILTDMLKFRTHICKPILPNSEIFGKWGKVPAYPTYTV